jgi:hypothetical protein
VESSSEPNERPEKSEPLARFLHEVPWFQDNLGRYDRRGAIRLLAGMLVLPEFHANSVRIEALVHLAVGLCTTGIEPRRDDLIVWFNLHAMKSGLRYMEDPLEDVFVSNVYDGTGNHRVFEGLYEQNDYWLQCLLRFLPSMPANGDGAWIKRSVAAVLALSDEIAERNGLKRYDVGGGEEKEKLKFPSAERLESAAVSIEFTPDDLVRLGIEHDAVAPFVWDDAANADLLLHSSEKSNLERRPIVRIGERYLVVLPSALSMAIRRFVLENLRARGELRRLDAWLNSHQGNAIIERSLKGLKTKMWKPPFDIDLKLTPPVSLTLVPFQFDTNKFGFLCLIVPPLDPNFEFFALNPDDERWSKVIVAFHEIANSTSKLPGFAYGLTIFVGGGLGAGTMFAFPDLPPNWVALSYNVPDFLTLASVAEVDMLLLWRLAVQVERARKLDVYFVNPNGDFNLLADWRQKRFQLIPPEAPLGERRILLTPTINALLEIRHHVRTQWDRHGALRPQPARWFEVERKSADSAFELTRQLPFYVPLSLLVTGQLCGVVEAGGASWWIALEAVPSKGQTSLAFQVWDCLGHWLAPVARCLASHFSCDGTIHEIRIHFPDLSGMPWEGSGSMSLPAVPLSWRRDGDGRTLLEVTSMFLRSLGQPANLAEREMVRSLLQAGAAALEASVTAETVADWTDEILPLGRARLLHMVYKIDVSAVLHPGPVTPQFVRVEVEAEVRQELGAAIAPESRGQFTEDAQEIRRLIHAGVAHLKARIIAKLQAMPLKPIVKKCLHVLDLLNRDHFSWDISAAALFALNPDREETIREARDQESRRAGTNIAARIVLETALYAASRESTATEFPQSEFDEIMGMTQLMIRIADYAQPIRAGFPPGRVTVSRSGDLNVENEFLDSTRFAYIKSAFADKYGEAAERYAWHFRDGSSETLPDDLPLFDRALQAEFGGDTATLIEFEQALHRFASELGIPVIELRRSELAHHLANAVNKPAAQMLRILETLRIYPRSAWDKDLPPTCKREDTFPWLFKRRFSLLRRPIIELDLTPDPLLLVSPVLAEGAVKYLIGNAYEGFFPPSFFTSAKMREFQQHASDRRSAHFVAAVALALEQIGYKTEKELSMAKIGAPTELGDIDVLAWRPESPTKLLAIECKALRNATSATEILSQLDEFRGEARDLLTKHIRRMNWLMSNPESLRPRAGEGYALEGMFVMSHKVPMQFTPTDAPLPFLEIDSLVEKYRPLVVPS